MPGRYFLIVLLLILAFPGRAQNQHLLHKTYAERYEFLEKTFYTGKALKQDSSVFFGEVNKLAGVAQNADDEELWLETQMLRCEYYMFGRQKSHRLFETRMLELKELADKKEIKQLQIRTRQKLGYFYFAVSHKYGFGFDNYLSSYQLLKDIPVKEMPSKQGLIANIGTAYYQFGDNANARKFLTEAWQIPPPNKKRQLINLTNTLGLLYRQEKKYDSAVYYFWKSYRMAEKALDSTWMGIAAGNIGISFYEQQKYREAIPLLELDIRESIKAREFDNAITSLLVLAQINLHFNNRSKTEKQVQKVRELLPHGGNTYKHLKGLYPLQAKLSALKGDSARAFLFSDSAHAVKDSLNARQDGLLALKAERKIELEKHRADMLRLEAQKEQQTILRNSLIGGIFLLMIIGILVINRQKIIHRQKQLKLETEKNHIASELEMATRQLSDFTNSIREKNKLLEKYSAEIENQNFMGDEPELLARKEARDKLLKATILTDDQWENFRQLFDKVHDGYLLRLREKLPTLSPAETRYFVLSKLNLTSKEMASMLGVRPDAIRLYRHRLRKKLQIEDDKTLETLVKNI